MTQQKILWVVSDGQGKATKPMATKKVVELIGKKRIGKSVLLKKVVTDGDMRSEGAFFPIHETPEFSQYFYQPPADPQLEEFQQFLESGPESKGSSENDGIVSKATSVESEAAPLGESDSSKTVKIELTKSQLQYAVAGVCSLLTVVLLVVAFWGNGTNNGEVAENQSAENGKRNSDLEAAGEHIADTSKGAGGAAEKDEENEASDEPDTVATSSSTTVYRYKDGRVKYFRNGVEIEPPDFKWAVERGEDANTLWVGKKAGDGKRQRLWALFQESPTRLLATAEYKAGLLDGLLIRWDSPDKFYAIPSKWVLRPADYPKPFQLLPANFTTMKKGSKDGVFFGCPNEKQLVDKETKIQFLAATIKYKDLYYLESGERPKSVPYNEIDFRQKVIQEETTRHAQEFAFGRSVRDLSIGRSSKWIVSEYKEAELMTVAEAHLKFALEAISQIK